MATKYVSASARMQVTIELSDLGNWGVECTIDQIQKQGMAAGIGRLRKIFGETYGMKVIGEPKIIAFTVEE